MNQTDETKREKKPIFLRFPRPMRLGGIGGTERALKDCYVVIDLSSAAAAPIDRVELTALYSRRTDEKINFHIVVGRDIRSCYQTILLRRISTTFPLADPTGPDWSFDWAANSMEDDDSEAAGKENPSQRPHLSAYRLWYIRCETIVVTKQQPTWRIRHERGGGGGIRLFFVRILSPRRGAGREHCRGNWM
jgi:hypothetical protein